MSKGTTLASHHSAPTSNVVDFISFRRSKEVPPTQVNENDTKTDEQRAIEEIARHLLAAVRVLKRLHGA